jgi:hypothetical protein
MVAQHRHGPLGVQRSEFLGNGLHGPMHQLKPLCVDVGGFQFPAFAHIDQQGLGAAGSVCLQPIKKSLGSQLLNHGFLCQKKWRRNLEKTQK